MNSLHRLTRKLVLEERRSVPDGSGGFALSWQALGSVWAEVVTRTSREDFLAGMVWPRVKYRIVVRSAPVGAPSRPRPDQRLREGERVFNILAITEADPTGMYLEITAEEGVSS